MLLALDTSVRIAVALVDPARPSSASPVAVEPVAARAVDEQRRHAELLAPLVTEVLRTAGVDRAALTGVAVGTGPAPFTGLRAALVTARTIAFALGVPVAGVCSLDVLAAQAYRDGVARSGDDGPAGPGADGPGTPSSADEVVVVTDARRREVYWARYAPAEGGLVRAVVPPRVGPAHEVAEHVAADGGVVVGPGAVLHDGVLAPAPGGPLTVDPAVLAALALARTAAGVAQPTEPLYLRRPDVTPSAGRKRATG